MDHKSFRKVLKIVISLLERKESIEGIEILAQPQNVSPKGVRFPK